MPRERFVTVIEGIAGTGKTAYARRLLGDRDTYLVASDISDHATTLAATLCIDDVPAAGAVRSRVAEVVARRCQRGASTIVIGRSVVHTLMGSLPLDVVNVVATGDLRLDEDEVRARFAAAGAGEAETDELAHLCDGWAAAVAFVERRLRDGVPPALLLRADDAWQQFWTYATHNVLEALDGEAIADLAAVACTPSATITDFAAEQACSLFAASGRLKRLPFVTVDERGRIVVSPLLLPLLRAGRPAELVTTAQALAAARPAPAAIATLLRAGDLAGAAHRAEHSIEVIPALQPESARLLAELPQSILRSHPRLWLSVGMPRWWHDDTAEIVENAAIALDAAPASEIDTRYGLTLMIFPTLIGNGQRDRARALVDRLLEDARASAAPHHPILATLLEAAWLTFDEHDFDIEAVRQACTPLFGNPGIYFVYLVMPLWTWHRIHGRAAEALETYETALSVARELMPGSYADTLQGAVYTAWLAGNDARKDELLAMLRDVIRTEHFERAHGFVIRAAAGDPAADEARDLARPWAIAEGLLMRAALRDSVDDARRDLTASIAIADRIGFREMVLTARVALAVVDDAERYAHLREAARIARQIGTAEMLAAVDRLAASDARDAGPYQPVVRRFERLRAPVLRIGLLDRTVDYDGRRVRVSAQQLAVLTVIALGERAVPRRELSRRVSTNGALLPERVLEVQLARLRQKLGSGVILHDGDGYRFGVPYTTDWHEARQALDIVRDRGDVQRRLDAMTQLLAALVTGTPSGGGGSV